MWILVIIMFAIEGNTTTVLNTFSNKSDCISEKERIAADMAESYPGDTTFKIDCQPVPSKA